MAKYTFERECRTLSSESYIIVEDDKQTGRVDLHFAQAIVYATLCTGESKTEDDIKELIGAIDDELVMSAGVDRDNFIVSIFQGRDAGLFSDEDFEKKEGEE